MVRVKYRYLLCELVTREVQAPLPPSSLDKAGLLSKIKDLLEANYGSLVQARVNQSLKIVYSSPLDNLLMIRIGREETQALWGTLIMLTRLFD